MNTKQVAVIAVLTALSIGTNYAMIPLNNVKLMDMIVFVGGFCFGPLVGTTVGVVSWVIYGTLNPHGFVLPIWLSTMFSEPIYGLGGAFLRKSLNGTRSLSDLGANAWVFFGALGTLLTFAYDVITNVVFGYVSGWSILFALIVGFFPMGLIHVVSNALFFGVGCVPTVKAIMKFAGGETSVASEE